MAWEKQPTGFELQIRAPKKVEARAPRYVLFLRKFKLRHRWWRPLVFPF